MAAAAAAHVDRGGVVWGFDSTAEVDPPRPNHAPSEPLFLPFATSVSADIEKVFETDPEGVCVIRAGGTGYKVDFSLMVRQNLRTSTTCDVQRWDGARACKKKKVAQVDIPAVHTFTAGDSVDWAVVTKWARVLPPTYDPTETDLMEDELGDGIDAPVVELSCSTPAMRCIFRQSFITRALNSNPTCCSCAFQYPSPGPQPSGTMSITRSSQSCTGFENTGSITIDYRFPDGVQHGRMVEPGEPYSGTRRVAHLPDTPAIGERATALLVRAFMMGHIFRVGTSITTNQPNTTIWAGIHHKTRTHGGVENHGWPDPTFMDRLVSECAAAAIMEAPSSLGGAVLAALETEALKDEAPPPLWSADAPPPVLPS